MPFLRIKLFFLICCFQSTLLLAQEDHDIIDGKDYSSKFYVKVSVGTGNTDWRLHFPDNLVDTSNRFNLPPKNKLKFKGKGEERYLGFSALFELRWGKFGGGFESSRLEIDSLQETLNGQQLHYSYHKDRISFNRFYVEYETNGISIDQEDKFFFAVNMMLGTYILTPVDLDVVPKSNLFVMLGPQIEHKVERWLSVILSTAYEFRYFNTKELFGSRELVYNNYINSFNIKLGLKFRLYHSGTKYEKPPAKRVL